MLGIDGIKSEPLFPTEEAYQEFMERFAREVKPALDRQRIARALSEDDARRHPVD